MEQSEILSQYQFLLEKLDRMGCRGLPSQEQGVQEEEQQEKDPQKEQRQQREYWQWLTRLDRLNRAAYKRLGPVFLGEKYKRYSRFVFPVSLDSWKSGYSKIAPDLKKFGFTLFNQPENELRHIWCWSNLGHQIGHNLFQQVSGLKDFLQANLERTFDEECLSFFREAYQQPALTVPQLSKRLKGDLLLSAEVRQLFLKHLGSVGGPLLPAADLDSEAVLLVSFLKFQWLHWLENCFADIIGLLLFDVASVLSFLHKYDFFTFERANLDRERQLATKQELIDWFLGFDGEYPIYFRFLFMTDALKYIEERLNRNTQFSERVHERFQPVIDIILDLKKISGIQKKTYRYQDYICKGEPFITIDLKLAENLVYALVPRLFGWVFAFLDEHHCFPAPAQERVWLERLAWQDDDLGRMDELIYLLINEEALPAEAEPLHLVAAARFAFELYPRRLEEINRKAFAQPAPAENLAQVSHTEPICLDFYFNREAYINWSVFSDALARLGDSIDPQLSLDERKLRHLPNVYKESGQFDRIMNELENFCKAQPMNTLWRRKVKLMLEHYQIFKDLRDLTADMENHLMELYYEGQLDRRPVDAVLQEDHFNRILDRILESSSINPGALEVLNETLFYFANDDPAELARKFYKRLTDTKRTTYGNSGNYFLLYQNGYLFNRGKYTAAIRNWFLAFSETSDVHREARKGRIKGQIIYKFFHRLLALLKQRGEIPSPRSHDLVEYLETVKGFPAQWPPGKSVSSDLADRLQLWMTLYQKNRVDDKPTQWLQSFYKEINREIARRIADKACFEDYLLEMKEAVKEIYHITLLWVHFKSVRAVQDLRLGKVVERATDKVPR